MTVPGINVLALASRAIAFQKPFHSRYKGIAPGDDGIDTPQYFPGVEISASVQPTPRTLYEQLGLDLQKDYITVYTDAAIKVRDTERGHAGDLLDWKGDRFTAESNTDWTLQDGWRATIFVRTGLAPP